METLACDSPPWLDLPDHLTEIILERLPLSDYIRFSAVCRRWRSVQASHRRHHCPWPPPMLRLPWFISSKRNQETTLSFYSPFEDRSFTLPLPPSFYPKPSAHGWLLIAKDSGDGLSLLNPISGAKIQLPPLTIDSKIKLLECAITVSPPPNYVVSATHYSFGDSIFLLRWFDSCWIELSLPSRLRTVKHKLSICGKHYFILPKSSPSVSELYPAADLLMVDPLVSPPTFQYFDMTGPSKMGKETGCKYRHTNLVEFDKEPLLIVEIFEFEDNCTRITLRFELFRADLGRSTWVKVESIGDRVLVIYECRPVSLLAADIGARGNCIYFASGICYSWGVFDLGTGRVTNLRFRDTLQIETCFTELFVPSLC